MKTFRHLAIALLAVAAVAMPVASNAASTTNFSDQWWIESESGWGASILQQADVLFVDLFVYDSNSKPTWFTAAAFLQSGSPAGHTVFTGDLYATTGPYYGAGSFDSSQVTRRTVGTLTFDASGVISATLSYTVDGVQVVKNVTRQTWKFENLSGSYRGGFVYDQVNCSDPSQNAHEDNDAVITISHNGGAITFTIDQSNTCTVSGTYTQSGHMGFVANASFSCPASGDDPALTGTLSVFEIERTINGFSGRFSATIAGGGVTCTLANGRIGGVRR